MKYKKHSKKFKNKLLHKTININRFGTKNKAVKDSDEKTKNS